MSKAQIKLSFRLLNFINDFDVGSLGGLGVLVAGNKVLGFLSTFSPQRLCVKSLLN